MDKPQKEDRCLGTQNHWGTGSPTGARRPDGRTAAPAPGRPGQEAWATGQGRRGPGRPGAAPSPPRPAGGGQVARAATPRFPGPNGVSAGGVPGCPAYPHLQRGGNSGSGCWHREQRNRKQPEVKGGDRNRLENRKLGFETSVLEAGLLHPCFSLEVVINSRSQGSPHRDEGARPFRDCDHCADPYDPWVDAGPRLLCACSC